MKVLPAIVALLAVLALGIFLRSHRIEAAPFHADEAVQAVIFQDLLEKGEYRYDPRHYHGPLPHYLNFVGMRAAGYEKLAQLNEWQFRVLPVVAGVVLVLVVAASLWRVDLAAAVLAVSFAATSPMLVFFSRFGLHESLFTLCGFLATWAAAAFLQKPDWCRAGVLGFLTALMAAGKETWVFFAVAWLVAALALGLIRWVALRRAPFTVGVFLLMILLLFGGSGFLDFWRSYFIYETHPGHEKAASYFVEILFPNGGWCGEPWLWLGFLSALFVWVRGRLSEMPIHVRFLGLSGVLAIGIFSLIPYKTPWLMMLPLALCIPAAAWCLSQCRRSIFAWPLVVLAICSIVWQANCAWLVSQKRFFDSRIPLVYSSSSYQMPAFRSYLQQVNGDRPVAVIGTDYWPLPWYLRGFSTVGYFDQTPETLPPGYAVYLLCDDAMGKAAPAGEERLWGVRTDYLMRSVVTSPDAPAKPQ